MSRGLLSFHTYLVLIGLLCLFLGSIWLAEYQHQELLSLRKELPIGGEKILHEINLLEAQETDLTSIERVHKLSHLFGMIQPSKPANIIRKVRNRKENKRDWKQIQRQNRSTE